MTFASVNMKCYWTVNNSYWPPLHVSQYEVNTSWPPQQQSIVLQYWKPKINSFSYAEKKYGICAPTFGSTLKMANFPAGWPRLSAKFTSTLITAKQLLIKNKNTNQSKSSLMIWHYVSYLFLFMYIFGWFSREFPLENYRYAFFDYPASASDNLIGSDFSRSSVNLAQK